MFSTFFGVRAGQGYRVIDGDKLDLRFLDKRGVLVGLRAKGSAYKACSAFIVEPNAPAAAPAGERPNPDSAGAEGSHRSLSILARQALERFDAPFYFHRALYRAVMWP
jgi:hypothetical protein